MRQETKGGRGRFQAAAALACALVFLAGCDEERAPVGDAGGTPVTFAVELVRGYVTEMSEERFEPVWTPPPPYWYRPGFGPPRPGYPPGPWWGDPGFDQPVDVQLIAGDGPAEANLFRLHLHRGVNLVTVSVRPGRTVTLTVMVRGGREGWEGVGHFTVGNGVNQVAHLRLAPEGPALIVTQDAPAVGTVTAGGVVGTEPAATSATAPAH
jgi:hypothetical protein